MCRDAKQQQAPVRVCKADRKAVRCGWLHGGTDASSRCCRDKAGSKSPEVESWTDWGGIGEAGSALHLSRNRPLQGTKHQTLLAGCKAGPWAVQGRQVLTSLPGLLNKDVRCSPLCLCW